MTSFFLHPTDCLPPAGELPEPLSSMRDRLAELLGPPIDKKTKQQVHNLIHHSQQF